MAQGEIGCETGCERGSGAGKPAAAMARNELCFGGLGLGFRFGLATAPVLRARSTPRSPADRWSAAHVWAGPDRAAVQCLRACDRPLQQFPRQLVGSCMTNLAESAACLEHEPDKRAPVFRKACRGCDAQIVKNRTQSVRKARSSALNKAFSSGEEPSSPGWRRRHGGSRDACRNAALRQRQSRNLDAPGPRRIQERPRAAAGIMQYRLDPMRHEGVAGVLRQARDRDHPVGGVGNDGKALLTEFAARSRARSAPAR